MDTLDIIKKNQEYFCDERDLGEILSNAKRGLELYSTAYGGVVFDSIDRDERLIACTTQQGYIVGFTFDGLIDKENDDSECVLFPSKDNRDWTTFKLPDEEFKVGDYVEVDDRTYKIICIETSALGVEETRYELMSLCDNSTIYKPATQLKRIDCFDYKYLGSWEKILSRSTDDDVWCADMYCNNTPDGHLTVLRFYNATQILPCNPETIGLIGKREQAPEFYAKAWENK